MAEAVKRAYSSVLRAEQAQATRRAVVTAARELFLSRGYGETTVDAIAHAAGVNRKTVFTSVGSKLNALQLARDWAIAGDDQPIPVPLRFEVQRLRAEPDARVILRSYAHMARLSNERVAPLHVVIESAAGGDAGVRAMADEGRAQRLAGMRELAAEIDRRAALPTEISAERAADILWALNDPRLYAQLVLERGWSPEEFETWLAETLVTQLVRTDYVVAAS